VRPACRLAATVAWVRRALPCVALLSAIAALVAGPSIANAGQLPGYLALAESGATRAQSAFKDDAHGIWNGRRNVQLGWYDERLRSGARYPLATIWGSVPLFEALSAIALANPAPATRAALNAFAQGNSPARIPPGDTGRRAAGGVYRGAESYWDSAVQGFAPYPGDRGRATTWFDDNSWWGIAFVDAYRALGDVRLLHDAQAAFDFVARRGWDASGGGLWWNTAHTPGGQKSGEALAAGSLLGALLADAWQRYAATATAPAARAALADAAFDLTNTEKFLSWGDAHFSDPEGLYVRTQQDATPMPYVAGPQIEANELLCGQPGGGARYCAQAARLADAAYRRFAYRLNMGPQFDVIYLHWMLVYGAQTGDRRWLSMALAFAAQAQANARDRSGLYLRAWDGSDMAAHQAEPGMLRTDAATVELFAWTAASGSL
jgi:hypothetical protein